ncbi:MAG: GNAT family N-acetyltransferase [Acidimicrobiia bacterium]
MPLDVRPITDDELATMLEVDRRGFGVAPRTPDRADSWVRDETDRTQCAFENGTMVGCSRAYTFELTMPGGARVPVAGVSSVAVQPTHRRRGLLTAMIGALHDDARARGEVASVLTASESIIYKRFGYGPATWRLGCSLAHSHARLAQPVNDAGRVRLVTRGEADVLYREVYEQVRLGRAGMVSRPESWWPEVFWVTESGRAFFDAVHEDADGRADGYVAYEIKGEWYGGMSEREMFVWDFQATNPIARAALWGFVFGVDLVGKIMATNLPPDEPLRLMLADPRQLRTDFFNDSLWLLPLDSAALLGARAYSAAGQLTIEIVDPVGSRSRFSLDGGPDGASCREDARNVSAALTCSRSTLGALLLGGNSWATLAAAGEVDEHAAGAIARADAMFAAAPAPATLTWF